MITLISRWTLRDGCSPELAAVLEDLAAQVEAAEPRTLAYSVHLAAPSPLGGDQLPLVPQPSPIDLAQQTEVVFFEVYADAQAFSDHVRGPTFQAFLAAHRSAFYADPSNPDMPHADTTFYARESAFFRPPCPA